MARARPVDLAIVSSWLVLVAVGMKVTLTYDFTPGNIGQVATQWPPGSGLVPVPGKPTLVMVVHPECPCSRASLAELCAIAERLQGRATVFVLAEANGANDARLIEQVAQVAGARLVADRDGTEARRFGAETSGLTAWYDEQGALLFHGGITPSRGHQGDSPGKRAILALMAGAGGRGSGDHGPVFGCPLFSSRTGGEHQWPR